MVVNIADTVSAAWDWANIGYFLVIWVVLSVNKVGIYIVAITAGS
ncbi:hypothetical protein [Saccharibacter floricola]|nr:hypothetical protein [Saccharibacter floricola]